MKDKKLVAMISRKKNRQPVPNDERCQKRQRILNVLPEITCETCEPPTTWKRYDEDGYELAIAVWPGGRAANQPSKMRPAYSDSSDDIAPFPFLELPPEIRNRIYELVLPQRTHTVCIPDRLLRPSENGGVLRECTLNWVCLPCQLHQVLGTGDIGLSRANKLLHYEMSLMPYTLNTFSVHNLFYLQTFLTFIGPQARSCLKSIKFYLTMPTEGQIMQDSTVSLQGVFRMLAECVRLKTITMNIDRDNMFIYGENGKERYVSLLYLHDIPHIALLGHLRGLDDITNVWRWYDDQDEVEMGEFARSLAGLWRLPRSVDTAKAKYVEQAETGVYEDRYLVWQYIHWYAGLENKVEDEAAVETAEETEAQVEKAKEVSKSIGKTPRLSETSANVLPITLKTAFEDRVTGWLKNRQAILAE